MFAVTHGYASTDNYGQGILSIYIRSDPTLIGIRQFTRLANSGLNPNHFIIVISGMAWTLYTYNTRQYNYTRFETLSSGNIRDNVFDWPLEYTCPNSTPEITEPTPTAVSSNLLPVSYNSAGYFTFTNCTYEAGGYFRIGKIFVINIRVNVQTVSEVVIAGSPVPSISGLNTIPMTTHQAGCTGYFRNTRVKSCVCLTNEKIAQLGREVFRDLEGQRFGQLTY